VEPAKHGWAEGGRPRGRRSLSGGREGGRPLSREPGARAGEQVGPRFFSEASLVRGPICGGKGEGTTGRNRQRSGGSADRADGGGPPSPELLWRGTAACRRGGRLGQCPKVGDSTIQRARHCAGRGGSRPSRDGWCSSGWMVGFVVHFARRPRTRAEELTAAGMGGSCPDHGGAELEADGWLGRHPRRLSSRGWPGGESSSEFRALNYREVSICGFLLPLLPLWLLVAGLGVCGNPGAADGGRDFQRLWEGPGAGGLRAVLRSRVRICVRLCAVTCGSACRPP